MKRSARCLLQIGRTFCAGQGKREAKNADPETHAGLIRSGGRSSYIGFGKFEGMGSERGSIQKALDHLRELLEAQKAMPASVEQKQGQARFQHDIAMCHHRAGDVDSAVCEYMRAVELLETMLAAESIENKGIEKRLRFDLSSAMSGLSVALADKGDDRGALEYASKALEIRKGIMGANHASVAECLNNLGGLFFRQSNFNKAAEVYQESLRILLTKTQGKEENKYVALAYYNIGLTYSRLGIGKGVDAIKKALLIAEHVWGPNHDQTVQIRSSLEQQLENKKT